MHHPTTKARALQLYRDHGLAHAHHETGVPKSTIRDWAKATNDPDLDPAQVAEQNRRRTASARAAAEERWRDRRVQLKHKLGALAEEAADRARRELEEGSVRDAKDAALAAAIAIDKAEQLDVHADPGDQEADAGVIEAKVTGAREGGLQLLPGGADAA